MSASITPPQLGQTILLLMDDTPHFIDTLHDALQNLPGIAHKQFCVLFCCPTRYTEHAGGDDPDMKRAIADLWNQEEADFRSAERQLAQARAALEAAGADPAGIITRVAVEDSLLEAAVAELKRGGYSGVILTQAHRDIANRIVGKGITDAFRQVPHAAVWMIDAALEW
jgi:hypothetical protein